MAEKAKKRRVVKTTETVRSRSEKSTAGKTRRLNILTKRAGSNKAPRKEYQLPMPDNKIGRLMRRRVRFVPKYFREAWSELKQVTWPSRRETIKLSLAVFVFALIFGGLIWLVDYGLDNLFRKVLIG